MARWLTRDQERAEELVHDAVILGMKGFHTYRATSSLKSWMFTIIYRLNIRQNQKKKLPIADVPDETLINQLAYEPDIPKHLTDEEIIAALERLPVSLSELVMLVNVEGFTYADAAKILQIPIGTVMSRLYRARQRLRVDLEDAALNAGFLERAGEVTP